MSLEQRFETLVAQFAAVEGVTPPGETAGFGSGALRVNGKIFVMFVRGRLVLKLPKVRVDELVDAGEGVRFDANKGTPMKEWLSLDPASTLDWPALSEEAFAFVSRRRRPGGGEASGRR
jgi:hypothetical protein